MGSTFPHALITTSTIWDSSMFVEKNKAYKNKMLHCWGFFFCSKPIPKAVTHDALLTCQEPPFFFRIAATPVTILCPLPHHVIVGQTPKTSPSVVLLTRNWAMSKAKSWTKLNLCSASDATRPKLDFWSSGSPGTSLLSAHKVTDTTSQQSWAAG